MLDIVGVGAIEMDRADREISITPQQIWIFLIFLFKYCVICIQVSYKGK
jgi:hypothetical protein